MRKKECKQIQLKLPFEPDAEVQAEVTVVPFDTRASQHLQQHSKGLVDIPEQVERKPVRVSVGPDLEYLNKEEV